MAQTNFQTHLAAILSCGERSNLPAAGARFILGLLSTHLIKDQARSYLIIDALVEDAQRRFSIEVKNVGADQSSHLGRLYTRPGGFTIKIRKDIRPTTYRFVKAHELAHLLAYDRTWPEPRRCFPNSFLEEKLCDSIARHLLLPDELLDTALENLFAVVEDFNVKCVEELSKEFLVAPWQIVRRAIEKDTDRADQTVAILWKRESELTLRISDYQSPSGLYIPIRDRSLKGSGTNQAPWKAIEVGNLVSDKDKIQFGSLSGNLFSLAFPTLNPWPSVIQIVKLDLRHLEKLCYWRTARAQEYQ